MQIFALEVVLILVFGLIILANAIRILREYERGVVFRLGRLTAAGVRGPGLVILIPIIAKQRRAERLREMPPRAWRRSGLGGAS